MLTFLAIITYKEKKVLEGQQTIMKYFHDIYPYINKCTVACPLTQAAAQSD